MGQRPMEILTVDTNVLRHQRLDEQIVRNKVCILSESAPPPSPPVKGTYIKLCKDKAIQLMSLSYRIYFRHIFILFRQRMTL